MVHERAWTEELRRGNRWDSRFPFGLGGMKPRHRLIQTQFVTDPPIQSLLPLFERLRGWANGQPPEQERPWPGQEPREGWVNRWG